jgi:hypothetical protein
VTDVDEYADDLDASFGRGDFSPADRQAAASVSALSEAILQGMAPDVRTQLLGEIDHLLDDFAPQIGRRRVRVAEGQCTHYAWFPADGGVASNMQSDVEVFGCEEMRDFLPFAHLLQQLSRDVERAFLKAISVIVWRDFGNGDYRPVVTARRTFDIWFARLITRDEHTHEKRRKGGRHRGADLSERKRRTIDSVLKIEQELSDLGVPTSERVSSINKRLDRGSDAPYPSSRQIRRMLKEARRLP